MAHVVSFVVWNLEAILIPLFVMLSEAKHLNAWNLNRFLLSSLRASSASVAL
ncbi:MAG: hypothetical protein K2N54_05005 [Helicobacter sp.]|nr:hypothetical protein [Helicobacter sp.]